MFRQYIRSSYIEDDVNVLPIGVCQAFAKSAQILGCIYFRIYPCTNIEKKDNSFLIQTTTGHVEAKHVVVASGVWSTTFFKQLGLDHQMTPVKGECLSVSMKKRFKTYDLS